MSNIEVVDLVKQIKKCIDVRNRYSYKTIEVNTVKLKCEWTKDMYDDLKNFHSIDASEELKKLILNGRLL